MNPESASESMNPDDPRYIIDNLILVLLILCLLKIVLEYLKLLNHFVLIVKNILPTETSELHGAHELSNSLLAALIFLSWLRTFLLKLLLLQLILS
jgi:hypothetical protein